MNYEEEFEKLNQNKGTWKPEQGKYKVEILEEPEETEYIGTDGTKTPQIKLLVNVDGEGKVWYVSKGTTTESLYGQLIAIGNFKGKLKGEIVNISVKQGKERKSYIVDEYLSLPTSKEENIQ